MELLTFETMILPLPHTRRRPHFSCSIPKPWVGNPSPGWMTGASPYPHC